MYHSFGTRDIIETIILLSHQASGSQQPASSQALKTAYSLALHRLQPKVPLMVEPRTLFTTDPAITQAIMPLYRVHTAINDLNQHNLLAEDSTDDFSMEVARLERILQEAFAPCDDLWKIFNLVINYVFCAPASPATQVHGASTSAAVGVIWATPLSLLSRQDIAEFFLHELTHNLVHLDELRHGHYQDSRLLPIPGNYASSSVLQRRRPMDKALHSLVVATEILLFRERYTGHPESPVVHPPSRQLLESALDCGLSIAELHSRRDFVLTKRAVQLVDRCQEIISHISARSRRAV